MKEKTLEGSPFPKLSVTDLLNTEHPQSLSRSAVVAHNHIVPHVVRQNSMMRILHTACATYGVSRYAKSEAVALFALCAQYTHFKIKLMGEQSRTA